MRMAVSAGLTSPTFSIGTQNSPVGGFILILPEQEGGLGGFVNYIHHTRIVFQIF